MRKYGKWVLTLSLLAATPGLTFGAGSNSKDLKTSMGTRASRTDNQRVAEDIANAMRNKVQGDISIEYKDGVAVLGGSVSDPRMKQRASELAEKVSGVSKVDNRISVAEKKRSVAERLRGGDGPGGNVTQAALTGESPKSSRVQQVNAELPLPEPSAPVSPSGAVSGNQEIAEQIGAALTTARLDGYDIQIRFQGGVAMLDGNVGTQAERATATRVVESVVGVRSVTNHLQCLDDVPRQVASAAQQRPYGSPQGAPYGPPQGAPYGPPQGGAYGPPQGPPQGAPQGNVQGARYMQPGPGQYPAQQMSGQQPPPPGYPGYQGGPAGGGMPMGPGAPPYPPSYGNPGGGASQAVYNSPSMPDHAWPTYAQYPNSAAVSYPQQYSASAWPYIGPFYPYPQVPLGWRDATLRWDDGQWNLMFKPRTDRWWWFFNPNNW